MKEDYIRSIVKEFITQREPISTTQPQNDKHHSNDKVVRYIPVGVSNRHLHVSREHLNVLYGEGYELTKFRELTQIGEFASNEFVTLVSSKGVLEHVRILGPIRKQTQIQIARTDAYKLGLSPPVRDSGDLAGTPGVTIIGPKGTVVLEEGVILPFRHIHMHPHDAEEFQVQDRQIVRVKTQGVRNLIFDQVIVRVRENFVLDFHIDTDEANAACLQTGDKVIYLGPADQPAHPEIIPKLMPPHKRRLITEADVREAIVKKERLAVHPDTIVTPSARELGRFAEVFIYSGQ